MGVTYCNLKLIVKDSGDYHEIRWNVHVAILLDRRNVASVSGVPTECRE